MQGGDFTEAVSCDSLGFDTQFFEQREQSRAGGTNCWLCPLCGTQGVGILGEILVIEAGYGKDHLVEALNGVHLHIGRSVPGASSGIEVHREGAAHSQVLASLAGEHEGDASV